MKNFQRGALLGQHGGMGQAFEDPSASREGLDLGNRPCIWAAWMETYVPPPQADPELMGKGIRRPVWPSRSAAFLAWVGVGAREGAGTEQGSAGVGRGIYCFILHCRDT